METATIELMKEMADDAKKAEALVEDDTCLGGLVMVLSNPDSKIVTSSLETLTKLAQWPNHRPHMKKFLGMMDQLKMLISQSTPSIKQLAKKLLELLQGEPCMVAVPLMDTSNQMNRSRPQKSKRRNSFFVGGSAKGKSVVLEIQEISSKCDIEQIRDSVVKVKGVISITFDMKKKRCLMRTKNELRPEILARKIYSDTGMTAEQVIRDDKGEEVFVSFIVGPANGDKENLAMPDYPDDVSPIKGTQNIAKVGGSSEQKDNKWTFVKTVGSFLTNSFYW